MALWSEVRLELIYGDWERGADTYDEVDLEGPLDVHALEVVEPADCVWDCCGGNGGGCL